MYETFQKIMAASVLLTIAYGYTGLAIIFYEVGGWLPALVFTTVVVGLVVGTFWLIWIALFGD